MGPTRHVSIKFGVYEVDLDDGEVRKSGVRIKVQQQPFKVLQVLLEHPGELVTREQLHSRIWPGTGYGDFDQAVNVAVAKLRTALGDSAENPRFIETVPRRGYRFIAPVHPDAVASEAPPVAPMARNDEGYSIAPAKSPERPKTKVRIRFAIAMGLIVIAITAAYLLWPRQTAYTFHRISYGKGAIRSARFGPDGHSIIYGAAWNGNPVELFWSQGESPQGRQYSVPDADILAVSLQGELAILMNRRAGIGWISRGTLATIPVTGGAPREILENVQDADWDQEGKNLAIVHWVGKRCNLEFPVGTPVYAVTGGHWLSDVRVSPHGELAFLEHPLEGDDAGLVEIIDANRQKRVMSHLWLSVRGLAWDPSGDSLWFSASETQGERERPRAIYRLTLTENLQRVVSESGDLTLHDVSRDRALLLSRDVERYEILANASGVDRDLSWLDFSRADDLSSDGGSILLTVEGEAALKDYEVYVRNVDGSPPIKLGPGYGASISQDGQWALAITPFGNGTDAVPQLVLLPVGKGSGRRLTQDAIAHYSAGWFPDGRHIVFVGSKPAHAVQSWIQDLNGGAPEPVTPEGVSGTQVSPDGKFLSAVDEDGAIWIYPVKEQKPERLKGAEEGDVPVGWGQDEKQFYVARSDHLPIRVYRLDLVSGKRDFVREFAPRDAAGVIPDISSVFAGGKGPTLVYSYFRLQSDLYIAASK
jgi:eukaryotic-like serine/threonine-protein kinase